MKKEIITLRGHHLYGLYVYKREQDAKEYNKNILNILRGKKDYPPHFQYGYTEEEKANMRNLFERILKNKDISIKINDSLDDICTNCQRKRESCIGDKEGIDKMTIDLVELDNGKTYSQEEILKKLNNQIASYPILQFNLIR